MTEIVFLADILARGSWTWFLGICHKCLTLRFWVCTVEEMKIWLIHPFCFPIKTKKVSYNRNKLQRGRNTLSKQTFVKNALLEIFILRSWKLHEIEFHSGITWIKGSLHVKKLNGGPKVILSDEFCLKVLDTCWNMFLTNVNQNPAFLKIAQSSEKQFLL